MTEIMLLIVLLFMSGALAGTVEAMKFKRDIYNNVLGTTNHWWFDPSISYRNKYKNGVPANGARFLGSTTVFVWVTDFYHFAKMMSNLILIISCLYAPTLLENFFFVVLNLQFLALYLQ